MSFPFIWPGLFYLDNITYNITGLYVMGINGMTEELSELHGYYGFAESL